MATELNSLRWEMPPHYRQGEKTRADTRLPQARAGGQGLYLRSQMLLDRSSEAKDRKKKKQKNRSPKGNMWSAIPVALLCMIVNLSDMKWSRRSKGGKVC